MGPRNRAPLADKGVAMPQYKCWMAIGLGASSLAWGGGFQVFEHSVRGLGTAFAEQAAASEPSTVFWNPAGMTHLPGKQFSMAGYGLKPTGRFSDQGSRTFLPPPNGLPLNGGDGGDPGDYTAIPNVYYTQKLNARWSIGFGINTPFGLATRYDKSWVGRYYALHSELITFNINPALAYRINERMSIGGGLNIAYARAKLSNAIDFSTVCLAQANAVPALGPVCAATGYLLPGNPATDGRITVKGDDWTLGWNIGLLWRVTPSTNVGVTYRSPLRFAIAGDAQVSAPASLPASIAAAPSFNNSRVQTDIVLPETAAVALHSGLATRWDVSANATWTRWSRLQELRLRFANGAPDGVIPLAWRDAWRIALGATYRPNAAWAWRAGVAYDQSPVSAPQRSPRIPDAHRLMVGIGATFHLSPASSLDVGYGHWFVRDAGVHLNTPAAGSLAGTYRKPYIDVVGVQFNHRF
jgi:long-chain fatty acid transport protein